MTPLAQESVYSHLMNTLPPYPNHILKAAFLETPLGTMLAMADDDALFLLEFTDSKGLSQKMQRLALQQKSNVLQKETAPLQSIRQELQAYFSGELKVFQTPLHFSGTLFQNQVWGTLQKIPFGQTWSYGQLALSIGKPTAFRAAAMANGANSFPIILPCHRVIRANGSIGGYSGGLKRKEWLLGHEHLILKNLNPSS